MRRLPRAATRRLHRADAAASAQQRWCVDVLWNSGIKSFHHAHVPADEDVDHMFTVTQKHRVRLGTDVPTESPTRHVRNRELQQWHCPVTNQNERHLQEQLRAEDCSYSHVQLLDCAVDTGVRGLWYYPFFLGKDEQRALERAVAPAFRDPSISRRVKNTETLQRPSFSNGVARRGGQDKTWNQQEHEWLERNHPALESIGRRNIVHFADRSCEAWRQGFADLGRIPQVGAMADRIYQQFGAESGVAGPRWLPDRQQEWDPVLDRPPNFVRANEWLEHTSGMNMHVKPPKFGNYLCILNLHSAQVLQLCHRDGTAERRYDDDSPAGLTACSSVVLLPGSLCVLKYDARWAIPAAYTFMPICSFRRNSWSKDYRVSLMFCHYSESRPGDPADDTVARAPRRAAPSGTVGRPSGNDRRYRHQPAGSSLVH